MIKRNKLIKGFTLIELMISILLSSTFLIGITQIFSRTSQNFRTQRTLSNMMEDSRFALDKLNAEFRRTGFLSNRLVVGMDKTTIYHNNIAIDSNAAGNVYTIRNNGVALAGTLLTMGANEAIRGAANVVAAPTSDNVVIRYQIDSGSELANNQSSPCTSGFAALAAGEQNTDRHIITIIFYIATDAAIGSNVLYCRAFRENLDTGNTELLPAATLISNIERLRLLYGQSDGAGSVVYRTSAQITASALPNWERVIYTRISLVLQSEEINISVGPPGNYTLNGGLSVAPISPAERRIYRVFSTTAAFRNEVL